MTKELIFNNNFHDVCKVLFSNVTLHQSKRSRHPSDTSLSLSLHSSQKSHARCHTHTVSHTHTHIHTQQFIMANDEEKEQALEWIRGHQDADDGPSTSLDAVMVRLLDEGPPELHEILFVGDPSFWSEFLLRHELAIMESWTFTSLEAFEIYVAEQLIEEVAEQVALLREEEEKEEEKEIDSTPPPPSPHPTSQHGRLPALDQL